MRLCIIVNALPPFYSGAERRALQYAQQLNQQPGVQCVLIGLHRLPEGEKRLPDFPEFVHGIRLRTAPKNTAIAPNSVFALPILLGEIALRMGALLFRLRKQYDLVHIFNPATWFSLVPIPIAKGLGKPVIVEMTLRGSDDPLKLNRKTGRSRRQLFPHRPLKYTLFLMADAYVSKSDGITQAYQNAGLPLEKLTQIPSGVEAARFKPASEKEQRALRKQLGLPEQAVIILFLGGMEERKGAYRLLQAFNSLLPRKQSIHLVLVGPSERYDPAYREKIEQEIARTGYNAHITFLPHLVDNPEEYMRAADIFALPSTREGFSMAIVEAMACGLPVVAFNIPEVSRIQVAHGVHGLLTPLGDKEALSNALCQLIENPTLRQAMGNAARERVLQEFTHEKVIQRYLELYTRVMQTHL